MDDESLEKDYQIGWFVLLALVKLPVVLFCGFIWIEHVDILEQLSRNQRFIVFDGYAYGAVLLIPLVIYSCWSPRSWRRKSLIFGIPAVLFFAWMAFEQVWADDQIFRRLSDSRADQYHYCRSRRGGFSRTTSGSATYIYAKNLSDCKAGIPKYVLFSKKELLLELNSQKNRY